MATGFVPFSAGLRAAARLQDPTERDAQGVYQRIVSGLPFAQESLPARVDPLGRTEANRGAAGVANAVLPSPVSSTAPLGLVDAELARLGVYPGPEGGTVVLGNQRVRLTPAQAQARQQAVGAAIRRAANAVVLSPGYASLTDEARRDLLQRDTERARRAASKQYDAGLRATGAGRAAK